MTISHRIRAVWISTPFDFGNINVCKDIIIKKSIRKNSRDISIQIRWVSSFIGQNILHEPHPSITDKVHCISIFHALYQYSSLKSSDDLRWVSLAYPSRYLSHQTTVGQYWWLFLQNILLDYWWRSRYWV